MARSDEPYLRIELRGIWKAEIGKDIAGTRDDFIDAFGLLGHTSPRNPLVPLLGAAQSFQHPSSPCASHLAISSENSAGRTAHAQIAPHTLHETCRSYNRSPPQRHQARDLSKA